MNMTVPGSWSLVHGPSEVHGPSSAQRPWCARRDLRRTHLIPDGGLRDRGHGTDRGPKTDQELSTKDSGPNTNASNRVR